jgi:hypothetical protein
MLLSRAFSARQLGVHVSTVRRMETAGILKPTLVNGVHYVTSEAVSHVTGMPGWSKMGIGEFIEHNKASAKPGAE